MRRSTSLLLIAMLMMLPVCSFAQTKIGYISVDEIFAMMPETKKADASLAEYQKALQEAYAQQETEVNNAYEKFIKDSAKLTSAVKEARRADLQTRITELQNKQGQLSNLLEAEKEKQLKPIREKLLAAIKTVAKENNYNHVLYKEQAIVFPESDDITALVKKKLGMN